MKILMFGRGTIAVIYGWALKKAGHQVDFYVRPGSAAKYGSTVNLEITDDRKKVENHPGTQIWDITILEYLPVDHHYDLIILSVPHYKFKEAALFLADRAANATILIFNNFWQDPLEEASALPSAQVAWGFPQAGGAFVDGNMLKGALFSKVHFGTFGTAPTGRELEVRILFKNSGFKIKEHIDFRGWLWTHFAIIAGYYARALPTGTIGAVMASAAEAPKAVLQIREILKITAARGVDLSGESSLYKMPVWLAASILRMLMRFNAPFRKAFSGKINKEEAEISCNDVMKTAQMLSLTLPILRSRQAYFHKSAGSL